jgi:hypothetical protein
LIYEAVFFMPIGTKAPARQVENQPDPPIRQKKRQQIATSETPARQKISEENAHRIGGNRSINTKNLLQQKQLMLGYSRFFILQTSNDDNLRLLTKKRGATIASATVAPSRSAYWRQNINSPVMQSRQHGRGRAL